MELCPDSVKEANGRHTRCETCPLEQIARAQGTEPGQLLQRALGIRAALKMGVTVTLDEIAADEFFALAVIEEEQSRWEDEKSKRP